jgi:hypothetical protein
LIDETIFYSTKDLEGKHFTIVVKITIVDAWDRREGILLNEVS